MPLTVSFIAIPPNYSLNRTARRRRWRAVRSRPVSLFVSRLSHTVVDAWKFTKTFDASRLERLNAVDTFDDVVKAIHTTLEVVGGWVCPATELGASDCWRPIVAVTVEPTAFDVFFNSPLGYRGQFLLSPEAGQAANSVLLRTLEPALTKAVIIDCGTNRLSAESIHRAFLANSAKIWPDESELDFTQATNDLDIGRWRDSSETINAPTGAALWAPEGNTLLAIGAFIDPFGNEVVTRRKILRRFELHESGFT